MHPLHLHDNPKQRDAVEYLELPSNNVQDSAKPKEKMPIIIYAWYTKITKHI